MPPIGTPISTHEGHEDTERLMSWAGFPELPPPDTTPWYQRTAVAVAGGVAVIGLIALVIAVVTVSEESAHPGTPPTRISTSLTPLPAGPAPSSAAPDSATPSAAVVAPPPAPAVEPGPPTVADTLPPELVNPPTIASESPTATANPGPGPNLPWWLHRFFPRRFPDGQ